MIERSHKNLDVWHRAMDLVTHIYAVTKMFPKEETYGLTSQMRRAAVSLPSNLAEGHAMKNTVHYLKFVYVARGSLAELETQLMIAENLGYALSDALKPFFLEILPKLKQLLICCRKSSSVFKLRPNFF